MNEDRADFRQGVPVDPVTRLSPDRIEALHRASLALLRDPGVLCYNEEAVDLFAGRGCPVEAALDDGARRVRLTPEVVAEAMDSAPSRIVLGARDPAKRLLLDAEDPHVYFGTGSETNEVLEMHSVPCRPADGSEAEFSHPLFEKRPGSIARLCDSARLCNALPNVDFFIRNVNIQDEGVTPANKDVNVFLASLIYMSKHVQAGLTELSALDDVLAMAALIAGGEDALRENPLVSFIACLVKSPLQMVEDTTDKVLALCRRGLPVVVSSSPQGGSTAPIQEEGMVAQINAEILAGITVGQLAAPGAPMLYGAVPVRARLDTLHDLYGAPEFVHYNIDCIQMARHYGLPCYSTAGVGDASQPGLQSLIEKLPSHLAVAQAGAQYIHYAFGLLERTGTFCPVQAVIDDANVGKVKEIIRRPRFSPEDCEAAVAEVRKVMGSDTRIFARHIRKQRRRGVVSAPHPLEDTSTPADNTLEVAATELARIREDPGERLPDPLLERIADAVPGLLPLDAFQPAPLPS